MNLAKNYRQKLRKLIFKIHDSTKSTSKQDELLKRIDKIRIVERYENVLTTAEKRKRVQSKSKYDYILLLLDRALKHYRRFCLEKNRNQFGAFAHIFTELHNIVDDTESKRFKWAGEEGRGFYLKEIDKDEK